MLGLGRRNPALIVAPIICPMINGLRNPPNPSIMIRHFAVSHGGRKMVNDRLGRVKALAIDETRKLFNIFLYIWILLSLFSLHKALIFNENILTYQLGCAFINAWALAKVVLIGQRLSLGDRFRGKPLVNAIMFQAAIFAITLLIFYIIEETLIGTWHGKTFVESIPAIGDGTLQAIIITVIIMFFALIPFYAFTGLEQVIGRDILRKLLFGRKTEAEAPAPNSINSVLGALKPEAASTSSEGQPSITIWYYAKAGKTTGPVTDEELRTLIKNKEIDESAFVWNSSFGDEWKPIRQTYLIYAVAHLHQFPDIEAEL
jgi:hypothetical protein